jgi:hypothetical protein
LPELIERQDVWEGGWSRVEREVSVGEAAIFDEIANLVALSYPKKDGKDSGIVILNIRQGNRRRPSSMRGKELS